ncbi:signal recognition particle-docking protein FtsY [Bacteroidetes bacterium endosymbiont of Geopemphigus sp.]|uniref:signal recognition particle-docking protein FtsY n=1 Tax=Bacteroidetes bacterium endosymbiont of Geopemphigus sp. TaxID=2047937 RepID=UPI000CD314C9|nr:signal recognition particle-docking protein FtsY [Bacteroidetes bacterium endosymbiont of Geopemphigus sp.]
MSWFKKIFSSEKKEILDKGLQRTKNSFFSKIGRAIAGKTKVDEEVLDRLEEVLISSDVGVNTTLKIINQIEERVARDKYMNVQELHSILREEIGVLLKEPKEEMQSVQPWVIMVVGVNGVGKTTTIGKLAHRFENSGKKVTIGAADTFRAAAVEQLSRWAEKSNAELIKQGQGADPASVAFDALQAAIARQSDVVLIDTAGRLHNKINLMNELSKIQRVMKKLIPEAPHEVLLILDGSTGQNAFEQARAFKFATRISGLTVTKLDGTAKGGMVIGISDQFQIPVKYIGLGEGIEDLLPFDKDAFIASFFDNSSIA